MSQRVQIEDGQNNNMKNNNNSDDDDDYGSSTQPFKNGISPVNTAKPEIRPNHCHQEAESQPLTGGLTPLLLLSSLLLPRNNYSAISSKPIQLLAGLSLCFLPPIPSPFPLLLLLLHLLFQRRKKPEFLWHESED